jgi:hypothetical protein
MKKERPIAKFSPKIYVKLSLIELILLSIYLVTKKGEACTFERLVAECFINFPKVFSFKRYPKWPDASKLNRPLRTLREKGLIIGNARDIYSPNRFGESRAREILRKLGKRIAPESSRFRPSPTRSTDDRIIEYIKNSSSFSAYLRNRRYFSISEQEFRNLLRCTLETPDRVIKQNLEYCLRVAEEYKESDIVRFLQYCKRIYFMGGVHAKAPSH